METREHGLGFAAARNTLLCMIEPPRGDRERILMLHLSTVEGSIDIVRVYASRLHSSVEDIGEFSESLDAVVSKIPSSVIPMQGWVQIDSHGQTSKYIMA